MNDIKYQYFEIILNFIYSDIIILDRDFCSVEEWIELITISQFFDLERLINICEYKIQQFFNKENIYNIFMFAFLNNFNQLKRVSAEFLIYK